MSRKLESSPARREVSRWAAPNVTLHAVPSWPSIWLPMTTSTPMPSHWCRIRCDVENPVRAVLMLIMVAEPPSSSRVTSPGVVALSSATVGTVVCETSQRRPSTSSAGQSSSARVRSRSAMACSARAASEGDQPRLPST